MRARPLPKRTQMLLHKAYSTSTSTSKLNWRTQIKQNQLVTQISSIILQRTNWIPLLQNLNLSSKLTPFLFLQILHKTKTHPLISLNFFNWAISNLNFNPDLKTQCHVLQLSLLSGLSQSAKPILDSLIQTHDVNAFLDTLVQASGGKSSQLCTLNPVLECYSRKGLFLEGLEVHKKMRAFGSTPSIQACNSLLDALCRENELKLAWCFYGSTIRVGILPDKVTWSLIAHILCKDRNFDRIVKLLDMGICNSVMYNAAVDWFSRSGDFRAAFCRINEMCSRNVEPGFSTYSSILDGACKCGNEEVIERVIAIMVDKDLLPNCPSSDYDIIIQKLCDAGKVNAATMFFKRACEEMIGLQDATYGCMLRSYSKDGMLEEAIGLYRVITERGIVIKNSAYNALVNLLSDENQLAEGYEILTDIMNRRFSPPISSLSKFISSLCNKRRWREAEELLNMVVEKGWLPNSLPCCSLIKHYCSSRQIDKAVATNNTLEKLQVNLDITTYNLLLDGLVKEGRVEESTKVFDHMKELKLVDSASFTAMIRGLCRAKELKRAMKLHDEMLNMGLKPDKSTYKRLILEFKE